MTSLFERYRPTSFEGVVGQPKAVAILRRIKPGGRLGLGVFLGRSGWLLEGCVMKRRLPDYDVVYDETNDEVFVIRDANSGGLSVTNGAEAVVESLGGQLNGRRLLYYDSEGKLDELLVTDGRFAGFAPGPR